MRGEEGIKYIKYNTESLSLSWEDSQEFILPNTLDNHKPLKRLCISLGLSCNYSCTYCLQSHEKLKSISTEKLSELFEELDSMNLTEYKVEFWGGEPLLYTDSILKIADRYKHKVGAFSMITNGSLLTKELIDKLVGEYGVYITVSHDAQAQDKRKKDPLLTNLEALRYLFLKYPTHSTLHSVLSLENCDSKDRTDWFESKLGVEVNTNAEGFIVDYTGESVDKLDIFNKVYSDLTTGYGLRVSYYMTKVQNFFKGLQKEAKLKDLTTKCGIDKSSYSIFSLSGDDMTCHNFKSSFSINSVQDSKKCLDCPVVHLCKGGCPAINKSSKAFENNCDVDFQVNMAVLKASIEILLKGKYTVESIERIEVVDG